jgi:superfamily II DNA/RNA helicase
VLALGDYMSVECHACIGGTTVRDDMRILREGPHVVVGTPGRVYDMINRYARHEVYSFELRSAVSQTSFAVPDADVLVAANFLSCRNFTVAR